MLYDIRLRIDYDYQTPVAGAHHLIRVFPPTRADVQKRVTDELTIDPIPAGQITSTDFFGNDMHAIALHKAHEALRIEMRARVELDRKVPVFDVSPKIRDLAGQVGRCRSLAPTAPHHYLGESPRITDVPEITDFMRGLITPSMTVKEAASVICRAVHDAFTYDPQATDVNTPPADAFAQRAGVCQDYAHVMIAGLRGIGIPSGYVSGFLRTLPPEGRERLEGADAMHAWVKVWCGVDMGWLEFDPTNGIAAENDHIIVARGRDYDDVAPVIGVLRLSGGHKTRQAVDVVPLS